jgi:PAS domain S-box-containing protein
MTDVACNATVYRGFNGDVLGVLATGHDVTRQKAAHQTAQHMAAIVQDSHDAIISYSLNRIVTSWNPAAERMYGYTSAEIVGTTFDVIIPKERAGEIDTMMRQIRVGQHVEFRETERVRKDGTLLPVSVATSPIRDTAGVVVGASTIHRDVSHLKHAAEYARSLVEAALDPLLTISPEGSIDDVNQAAVTITGLSRGELIGTDFSHLFTDPDKAHLECERAFAQGSVTSYPLTMRRRDGTVTDVLCNASVYRDTDGRALGVLAAARDMANQKEAFKAAQRMAAIVEHSDGVIVSGTLDGLITSWNLGRRLSWNLGRRSSWNLGLRSNRRSRSKEEA